MSNEPPPSGTTAILPPPAERLPRPGSYRAAEDRCILEISAALGPLTTLRGRFAVLENSLVIEDTGDWAALSLAASAPSLRTTRPLAGRRALGRRGLDARRHDLLRLRADRISTVDRTRWHLAAELTVRATPIDITMTARIAVCEEDRIALLAIGAISSRTLREVCLVRLPRSVPADQVRLMVAADFR